MVAKTDLNVVLSATDRATPSIKNLQSTIIRFVGAVSAALAGLSTIAFPVKQAAEFERELKNVQKTTGFVDADIKLLGDSLTKLSKELVTPATDLATIAAVAGQLGLGREGARGIVSFTEQVARASAALDIAADQAALAGARIQNIFNLDISQIENVFSTINELSNTTTASAEQLVDVIQRIGSTAGLAFQETSALAATAIDVGVSQEVAGTSLAKVFARLSSESEDFAEALGVDIGEFIGLGALERFQLFLNTLAQQGAEQRAKNIRELAGQGRIFVTISKFVEDIANGTDLLNDHLETSNKAFDEGTSIVKEYEIQTDALLPQLQRLANNFTALSREVGQTLLPRLTRLTRDLSEFLNTDEARAFARSVGEAFQSAVNGIVNFVTAIGNLDINFRNLIATVKVFLALQLGRLFLSLAVNTGAWAVNLAIGASNLLGLGSLFRRTTATAIASTRASGVAAGSLLGLARTAGQVFLRLAGPAGIILGIGTLVFNLLEGTTFDIGNIFRSIGELFGFVSDEQADIENEQKNRIANLRKEAEKASADIRAAASGIVQKQFAQPIEFGIKLDADSGIEEFNANVKKAVTGVTALSAGVEGVGVKTVQLVNRQKEINLQLRDQEAQWVANQTQLEIANSQLESGNDIVSQLLGFSIGNVEALKEQNRLIRARQGLLREERDRNEAALEELRAQGEQFLNELNRNAEAIGQTFSRAQINVLQLAAATTEATQEANNATQELGSARERLADLERIPIDELDLKQIEAIQAAREQVAGLAATQEEAATRAKQFKDQTEEAFSELGQDSARLLKPTIDSLKGLDKEGIQSVQIGLARTTEFAGDVGTALDELNRTIEDSAVQMARLNAEKTGLKELAVAAEDLADTAKGAFDNTSRTIRAFRGDVLDAVRDLETGLSDRPIELRVRNRNDELDAQVKDAEERREAIIEEFDNRINEERGGRESSYLKRRREEALDAIDREVAAVESNRAFLEERALRNRIDRLKERAAELVAAAQTAARSGNIDEALGLSEAARNATTEIGNIIGEISKLEDVDPFGRSTFRASADEIRSLIADLTSTERQVSAAIPGINEDLRDSTRDAAKAIKDRQGAIDNQLTSLEKQLEGFNKQFPGFTKRVQEFAKQLESSFSGVRQQASSLAGANVLAGGNLRDFAAQQAAIQRIADNTQEQIEAANAGNSAAERERRVRQIEATALEEVARLVAFDGPVADGRTPAITQSDIATPDKPLPVTFTQDEKGIFSSIDAFLKSVPTTFRNLLGAGTRRPEDEPSVTTAIGGATGGLVSGPGTGTSDSIFARLSNGEYIIDAATRRFFGTDHFRHLQALARRRMKFPGMATGGPVGLGSAFEPVVQAAGTGGAPVHIHFPGGDTLRLREGESTVREVRTIATREALKRGRRLR